MCVSIFSFLVKQCFANLSINFLDKPFTIDFAVLPVSNEAFAIFVQINTVAVLHIILIVSKVSSIVYPKIAVSLTLLRIVLKMPEVDAILLNVEYKT